MRIIAGEFRGRRLLSPRGDATRPITDRVKQSLFDILTPLIPNAIVHDLFAGTGSLGIEALSRGAMQAVFFESDRSAARLLMRNIKTLGLSDRAVVHEKDTLRFFAAGGEVPQASLVFLDPPYRHVRERADDLRRLTATLCAKHLLPQALVVFRHDAADTLELPPLALVDRRTYGRMALELLSFGG